MTRASRLVGGSFAAILIAPWLGGVVANAASSTPAQSGDDRATAVAGNAVTCGDVGFPDDTQFGADNSAGNAGSGYTVTSDGQDLTVAAIPANTAIDVLAVKGGDAYNVYPSGTFTTLPVSGLHAPLVGNDENIPTISHWFLCAGAAPEQVITPPSATSTGDCDSAELVLDAGTLPTVFSVTRAGDAAGQTYAVGGGQSQTVPVSLDAIHPSVSATAGGPALTTFTRDTEVCDRTNGGGGDNNGGGNGGGVTSAGAGVTKPAVDAQNSCRSGVTVSLSNLDDTAPVTFTLTAPDGSISTATVGAGGTTSRSFAVTEDSTGTVTVAAPGLAAQSFTDAKDCVTVLGVKHVRHHATQTTTQRDRTEVLASSAELPFTGFNSRRTAADGAMAVGLSASSFAWWQADGLSRCGRGAGAERRLLSRRDAGSGRRRARPGRPG